MRNLNTLLLALSLCAASFVVVPVAFHLGESLGFALAQMYQDNQ